MRRGACSWGCPAPGRELPAPTALPQGWGLSQSKTSGSPSLRLPGLAAPPVKRFFGEPPDPADSSLEPSRCRAQPCVLGGPPHFLETPLVLHSLFLGCCANPAQSQRDCEILCVVLAGDLGWPGKHSLTDKDDAPGPHCPWG